MKPKFGAVYVRARREARDLLKRETPSIAKVGGSATGESVQERVDRAVAGAGVVYRRIRRPPPGDDAVAAPPGAKPEPPRPPLVDVDACVHTVKAETAAKRETPTPNSVGEDPVCRPSRNQRFIEMMNHEPTDDEKDD